MTVTDFNLYAKGSFLTRQGKELYMEIYTEFQPQEVAELEFPSDSPVVLEFDGSAKLDPVISTKATVKLISTKDRQFIDLYNTKPGSVRLIIAEMAGDQYAAIYQGIMDSEFYEEPYSYQKGYEVNLTFSDFGILKRKRFDLTGVVTFHDIITKCIELCGTISPNIFSFIGWGTLPYTINYLSARFTDGSLVMPSRIAIRAENFTDEDGETATYYEALASILQPFAWRIQQVNGRFYLYDLNGIVTSIGSDSPVKIETAKWSGVDAMLSVDKVYNKIKINFSAYSDTKPIKELSYPGVYGKEWQNLQNTPEDVAYNERVVSEGGVTAPGDIPVCYSYYLDYSRVGYGQEDYWRIAFTMFLHKYAAMPFTDLNANARLYKILPVYSGEESSGVVSWFAPSFHYGMERGPRFEGLRPSAPTADRICILSPVFCPALTESERKNKFIRIKFDTLIDGRYDPFEPAGYYNDQNTQNNIDKIATCFIPVAVELVDADGNAVMHWANGAEMLNGMHATTVQNTAGSWKQGAAQLGDAYFQIYSDENINGKAFGAFATNRQAYGYVRQVGVGGPKVFVNGAFENWQHLESFFKLPHGQAIPYPPISGSIRLTVYNGFYPYPTFGGGDISASVYNSTRWIMYKDFEISFPKYVRDSDTENAPDEEFAGELDINAEETLEISTTVGTCSYPAPSALGQILRYPSLSALDKIRRGEREARPEQLLLSTAYSQYATRHTTLSGEMEVQNSPLFTLYKDSAQSDDKLFLMTSEVKDLIAGESSVTLCEVSKDNFDKR